MIYSIVFSVFLASSAADPNDARILDKDEVAKTYTRAFKKSLKIQLSVYRVYEYSDKHGRHHLVLTEEKVKGEPSCAVRGYLLRFSKDAPKPTIVWKMKDMCDQFSEHEERGMWFWTRYFELKDYDGDGEIDPILVYGTDDKDGGGYGRLKILVYHHGQKTAVRHQNSLLDHFRKTHVDKALYRLPAPIRKRVVEIMDMIHDNEQSLFSGGWKEQFAQKSTVLEH